MVFRCPHLYNVMRFKGMDVSNLTPKRRTLSTRLKNQRLKRRTPGWKQPGQFDRASADTQVRNDPRIQRIREEQRNSPTPTAAILLQSAGLTATEDRQEENLIEAVEGLTPPPARTAAPSAPATSTPEQRPRAKRGLFVDYIDGVSAMESLPKKRRVQTGATIICETCDKTFTRKYNLTVHVKRFHA